MDSNATGENSMGGKPLSYPEQMFEDAVWFAKNKRRNFRTRIISDAEKRYFLLTRDGLEAAERPSGGPAIMVTFWRQSQDGPVIDHIIICSPTALMLQAARDSRRDDNFASWLFKAGFTEPYATADEVVTYSDIRDVLAGITSEITDTATASSVPEE